MPESMFHFGKLEKYQFQYGLEEIIVIISKNNHSNEILLKEFDKL